MTHFDPYRAIDLSIDTVLLQSDESLQLQVHTVLDGKEEAKATEIFRKIHEHSQEFGISLSENEFRQYVITKMESKLAEFEPKKPPLWKRVSRAVFGSHTKKSSFKHLEHEDLIKLLQVRYKGNVSEGGTCHGFAVMAARAFVTGNIDKFYLRLEVLVLLLEKNNYDYEKVISELETNKNWDLLAFLEGIHLGQEGHEYPELFSTTPPSQASLDFIPSILSITGMENPPEVGIFSTAIYDKKSLITMFTALEQQLETPPPITTFALVISAIDHKDSSGHAITIGYDHPSKRWYGMDINRKITYADTPSAIASFVTKHLWIDQDTTLSIKSVYDPKNKERIENSRALFKVENKGDTIHLLHHAEAAGDKDTVSSIQDSIMKDAREDFSKKILKDNPLSYAILTNNIELFNRYLLEKDLINKVDSTSHLTPLHWAISENNHEMIDRLIEHGATVNFSLFYDAILQNNYPLVSRMLEIDPSLIHQKRGNFDSPLYGAASSGNLEMMQLLIQKGANINLGSMINQSDFEVFAESKEKIIAKAAHEGDIIKVQTTLDELERARDLLNADRWRSSLRVPAVIVEWDPEILDRYLQLGLLPDETFLTRAIIQHQTKAIELLLQAYPDFFIRAPSVLIAAAKEGPPELVKLLIEKGADFNIKDWHGDSPLDVATDPEIKKLLSD